MRWRGRRQSRQVEDRRGRRRIPGGRGGAAIGGGGLLLILLFAVLTGQDPLQVAEVVTQGGGGAPGPSAPSAPAPGNDEQRQFVATVLADTEDTWNAIFRDMGRRYNLPGLVLFNDAVQSACGFNSAAVGPFYCPADSKVYIDLTFFRELDQKFGAPGDFARAYVIAHEVGHHVQNELGISSQVHQMRRRVGQAEGNQLSVRQELQADCLAGVWGHHAAQRGLLEPGDVEEGMRAAAAIGDDTLQRKSGGHVHPESWTHGSSAQRVRWFRRGLESGRADVCDTFETNRL
ncbi:MAG: neutral zinc metallopeptidase [Acidobacteriota bacterium]